MDCVTFLVNYGVNLWTKDVDYHTPTDLAAMNDRQEILRFLDNVVAKEERQNAKKVQQLKDKAIKSAEKRIKNFGKIQEKAKKLAKKDNKLLMKDRKKMEQLGNTETPLPGGSNVPRPSMVALSLRRDSRMLYGQSLKFSEIVNQHDRPKLTVGAVFKKVQQQQQKILQNKAPSLLKSSSTSALDKINDDGEFKIGAIEDGKRSVRSITGLRRDSEVIFVPNTKIISGSETDILNGSDSGMGDDIHYIKPRTSIFERPGFGSVALFRFKLQMSLIGYR